MLYKATVEFVEQVVKFVSLEKVRGMRRVISIFQRGKMVKQPFSPSIISLRGRGVLGKILENLKNALDVQKK